MRTGKKGLQKLLQNIGKPFYWLIELLLISIFSSIVLSGKLKKKYQSWSKSSLFRSEKRQVPSKLKPIIKAPLKTFFLHILYLIKQLQLLLERSKTLIVVTIPTSFSRLLKTLKPARPRLIIKISFKPKIPSIRLHPLFIIIFTLTTTTLLSFYFFILKDLPPPESLTNRQQNVTTKIYDRNHNLLFKIYKNENRSIISLSDLPLYLIQATIAIEDKDFYQHTGISLKGILRAIKKNLFEQKLEGGSTITQQLVKNALLTPEKTLSRKLKEVVLASRVELHFDKNQILQMYFNEVGYGGAAYGIEEASQLYFNKPAKKVNLAEAALLAGLPAAPTTYSPFGANPELALSRQHQVLRRMVKDSYITAEQAEKAKSQKLQFATQRIDIKAPHFVMYVKDLLVKKYGEAIVHQGGLEVTTSLDLNIQALTEAAIQQELVKIEVLNVSNASALVTNPKTGEILAMVGSKDYFDFDNDGQVNVTLRPRQPGSSIKPINYAVALQNGFTPATIIEDSPIVYRTPGSPPYAPNNYDGRFHGKITLRQALANSYNVPAVKTLSHFGVSNMIEQGQRMGITTWNDPSRFGLSLTLGGGEVKMIDMALVYGSLANQGVRVDLNPILHISDYKQQIYQSFSCANASIKFPSEAQAAEIIGCDGITVLNPIVAYQLTDILSDNNARARAFGRYSILNIPGQSVAVKTGTTNELRDNWTIGYTPEFLVATWVGNNDNTPMSYVASGITGASPIWNIIMTKLLENTPNEKFDLPQSLIKANICTLTGTLTCSACPNPKAEYFIPGTEPTYACNDDLINSVLEKQNQDNLPRDQILEGATTN